MTVKTSPTLRMVEKAGQWIFISAFVLFNAVLFMENYQLTESQVMEVITDPAQQRAFLAEPGLTDETFSSNIIFVDALHDRLIAANQRITNIYEISTEDVNRMIDAAAVSGGFQTDSIDWMTVFVEQGGNYKASKLQPYTGWMNGSVYTESDFRMHIEQSVQSIHQNLINDIGFSSSRIGELKLTLTKIAGSGIAGSGLSGWFWLTIGLLIVGPLMMFFPRFYRELPGIKHNGIYFHPNSSRGWIGIFFGTYMILFYIFLYFYPHYLTAWINLVDPVSQWLAGGPASQWFLYGFLYTIAIVVMGVRMFVKYRHNRYQQVRTASVMFFQFAIAFILVNVLQSMSLPAVDLKNIWPLDYSFFFEWRLNQYIEAGTIGYFMLGWGVVLIIFGVPLMTFFFGKRWYCSWVCGCGGLAETLGDPWRQLSDKSLGAWKIERWLIHSVLVFAILMTGLVIYTLSTGESQILGLNSYDVRAVYGFSISSIFAGVVGTGFYPLMGNRVWCRFGCPLAAYLGIIQRFRSRFRITTNGGQCISCGNCSTYCEMGIDVRWYAQRGQDIVRSSCVGCGVCAAVCPRGVLRLENGTVDIENV